MKKTVECFVSKDLVDFFDSKAPKFRINPKRETTSCTKEVVLKAYAFKGSIFSCEGEGSGVKDEVIVEIIDVETGEDITDEFTISMTLPEDSEGCPKKCSK
mmetsp:Transcript_28603/g.25566  ORF Transcript_28603/g.25566 Transcript_28603/m.25566 type:complete len:101 (-) Transcript_28603:1331-1633(-)